MSGLDHGQVLVDIIEDEYEIYPCELILKLCVLYISCHLEWV